jgi:hypothetical protein
MTTPTVRYLGPAHPERETEFYVVPPTRAGENPLGPVELQRSLKCGQVPAASGLGTTDSSPQAPELDTGPTDAPSPQSRRTLLSLKLAVPLTTIAMFALPTANALAEGHF